MTLEDPGHTAPPALNYLRDEPAADDQFGPHSRIAAAISSTIRARHDLEVIGLLGPWGSGKSTVINLLRGLLERELSGDRILCFQYDAWLHQSDPPRRSFLDALIRFLIAQDLTTEPRWRDRLAELNRQIEETDVQTTPMLSSAGRLLLPLALLVPFGFQFVDKDWLDAASEKDASWFEIVAFPLGLALTALPICVAGALWYYWRPQPRFWKREFWRWANFRANRSPFQKESLLSLFTNRETVAQKNRTVRTPDPTTIEFQSVFREILEDVRFDKDGRPVRLVFVIDNLDRMPETGAVEMWNTVRSFFLGVKFGITLPTVILPIDERSVERMYVASDKENSRQLAQSFMNKTFDLTFRVTPPVLSNWHKFLQTQLEILFGPLFQKHWPYVVGVLFSAWVKAQPSAEPITPRQLNTLLNDVGTLYAQWCDDDISFESIAYYAIFRNQIDSSIYDAVNRPTAGIEDHDPEWALSIAAMHYGVPRAQAAQVLLERRIEAAINGGSNVTLESISSSPGFELVLNQVVGRADVREFPVNRAVNLIHALGADDSAWSESTWRKLRALQTGKEMSSFVSDDLRAFKVLCDHCPEEFLEHFLDSEMELFGELPTPLFSRVEDANAIISGLEYIFDSYDNIKASYLKTTLEAEAKHFLKILAAFGGRPGAANSILSIHNDEHLLDAIAAAFTEAKPAFAVDGAIRGMLATGKKVVWTKVIEAAGAKFDHASDAGTAGAATTLLALSLNDVSGAQARADALIDSGQLVERFHEAFNANDFRSMGALAALILWSKNPAVLTTPDGSSWDAALKGREQLGQSTGQALTGAGVELLEDFIGIAEDHRRLKPLLSAAASEEFRAGRLESLSPKEVAGNYTRIYNFVPTELDLPIVTSAANSEEFWAALDEAPAEETTTVLRILLEEESQNRDRAAKIAQRNLESVEADVWVRAVKEDSDSYFLLADEFSFAAPDVSISGKLADGLRGAFDLLKANNTTLRSRWFKLATILTPASRKTLFRTARDWLANQLEIENLPDLLSQEEFALVEHGELHKKADDIVRKLITPLLAEGSTLDWLDQHAEKLKRLVLDSPSETRSALHERLQDHARSTDENLAATAESLRLKWGLPLFKRIISEAIGDGDESAG